MNYKKSLPGLSLRSHRQKKERNGKKPHEYTRYLNVCRPKLDRETLLLKFYLTRNTKIKST